MEWIIWLEDQFFDFAETLEEAKEKVIKRRGGLFGKVEIEPNRDKNGKHWLLPTDAYKGEKTNENANNQIHPW